MKIYTDTSGYSNKEWNKAFIFFKHEGDEPKGPMLAVDFRNLFDKKLN